MFVLAFAYCSSRISLSSASLSRSSLIKLKFQAIVGCDSCIVRDLFSPTGIVSKFRQVILSRKCRLKLTPMHSEGSHSVKLFTRCSDARHANRLPHKVSRETTTSNEIFYMNSSTYDYNAIFEQLPPPFYFPPNAEKRTNRKGKFQKFAQVCLNKAKHFLFMSENNTQSWCIMNG